MRPSRQHASFRPSIEALEDRDLLAATGVNFLPGHTHGHWWAGNQPVYIFAVEYEGRLNYTDAHDAWIQADRMAKNQNLSLGNPGVPIRHRTVPNTHLLFGWLNSKTKKGGWVAADFMRAYQHLVNTGGWLNPGTRTEWHTLTSWVSNQGAATNVEGWQSQSWKTRGYTITVNFAGDTNGDVDAYWTTPH
jgi:hypothetical protein